MSKHTAGPWQWDGNPCDYDKDNEAPWLVTDAYAADICVDLREGVILKGQIECLSEANARLIAAAPEMLEALEWIINATDDAACDRRGVMVNMPEALRRVRDAIAKATGEAS